MSKKETKLTVRIPNKLYDKILKELDKADVYKSINSFILECTAKTLERYK